MKVSDILRVKNGDAGSTLFTITPEHSLAEAMSILNERDIGSLVVMSHGKLVGMLTFREVIQTIVKNGGVVGQIVVSNAMDQTPNVCTSETDLDEVRRMMLTNHARYMPVVDAGVLMGVISFYDVAKTVVESQNFENQMLKAYIRDWPAEAEGVSEEGKIS
jgi:CBS domain-containing protein